jgi:hypothetical protein
MAALRCHEDFYCHLKGCIMTTDKIRALNDQFRSSFIGGRIVLTQGILSLGEAMVVRLM